MDDYIPRNAALNEFEVGDPDVCVDYGRYGGNEWAYSEERAKSLISSIPAADVVPVVHGHWVNDDDDIVPLDKDGCPVFWCRCSECGDWLTASDEYQVRGRYCPNCGADMRGEQG